jgi:hypothetical protein
VSSYIFIRLLCLPNQSISTFGFLQIYVGYFWPHYKLCFPPKQAVNILLLRCQVECPKYPGFCLTRQRNEYPFVEVFYNPEQVILVYFMYTGSNVSVSLFWFFIAISIPTLVTISHLLLFDLCPLGFWILA